MHDDRTDILLVDDKPENLLSLEVILKDLGGGPEAEGSPGVNLVKAQSGREALRQVLKHDFAVILIDVQMPEMDGFETVDLIKERERSRHTPVIFITALSKNELHITRGYSVGAVDYILKPIVPEILRSKVAVFVELFRKTQEVKRLNEDLVRRAVELEAANAELAREMEERKRSEEEVRRLNEELELRVSVRTAQLRAANEELRQEIAERKRLEQQKDEFIAVASHELRTPLTTVKGYTNLALRAAEQLDDGRLTHMLRIVADKTEQLSQLINQMLDVSRIQHDMLSLNCERFDLVELVRDVVRNTELLAAEFEFDVDAPPYPVMIYGDRQRIEQVVTNLLQNGIKYSGSASPDERKIEVTVTAEGGEAITAIRDYGVGIPADEQSQVFNRFFRASNVTSAHYPYPGVGLGLFIAHDLIERHGGRIWVESTEQQGSTFTFALPSANDKAVNNNSDSELAVGETCR